MSVRRLLSVLAVAALASGCGDAPTANPQSNVPEFKNPPPGPVPGGAKKKAGPGMN